MGEAKPALMMNRFAYSGGHDNDGRQFTTDLHQAQCGQATNDRAAFSDSARR
jgi:hypothetical protein